MNTHFKPVFDKMTSDIGGNRMPFRNKVEGKTMSIAWEGRHLDG